MSAQELYRDSLPPGEVHAFPLHGLDRAGVPVWTASWWPPEGGGGLHGVGYGPSDEQALTSAFGELAESVAVARALASLERTRGSYADLVRVFGADAVLDPLTACLPADSFYAPETPLEWVEARDHATGASVLVPVELVASEPEEAGPGPHLLHPVTNGLGAGDTPARALLHGVLELLQRDGNSVAYRALDRGIAVDTDPGLDGLRVLVKLAADDFGMANLYAVGWDEDGAAAHPLMATSCGEAVHPDPEVARAKAVHEYLSSRVRKAFCMGSPELAARVAPPEYLARVRAAPPGRGEERAFAAMCAWLERSYPQLREAMRDSFHRVEETVAWEDLPRTPDPGDPAPVLADVAGRLEAAGLPVLSVALGDGGPVEVVHAIVPGLEVETATYHRIGARNARKLLERDLGLVAVGERPAVPGWARVRLTEEAEAGFGGPVWFDAEGVDAQVGDLYPLYREPARHAVWSR